MIGLSLLFHAQCSVLCNFVGCPNREQCIGSGSVYCSQFFVYSAAVVRQGRQMNFNKKSRWWVWMLFCLLLSNLAYCVCSWRSAADLQRAWQERQIIRNSKGRCVCYLLFCMATYICSERNRDGILRVLVIRVYLWKKFVKLI